ncbi:MAG: endonuclease MutS2 [Selenomonadaceae bacterium]|nr:endonuclease MutS2 [Selenomonadaceae bacterium]
MEKDALKVLEYDKIREMLEERAGSALGKEKARGLSPSSDFSEVSQWMAETEEAVRIYAASAPPLGGIRDIRPLLKKVGMGAVLGTDEIVDVMSTMYAMRNVKRFFKEMETEAPMLKQWAHSIEILGQLERNLENAIDEHGVLRDDASVELRRIRREMRTAQNRIKERIHGVLHSQEYQKLFQEAIITVRDERYVIPIKQEYRSQFPGIVHDQSASGSTLFIEPMAIVELNNDVKQLALAEHQEVQRILRSLSAQIGKQGDILLENTGILGDIDFVFAKARLARDMHGTLPLLNTEGRTRLNKARHPLIPADRVVPIDIALGADYRMLLVTGPNTGGKTVSMKTLGLLVLMAQSGCYIPAASDSEVSVYHDIYADIGDEQSIEQSLSTFSSHMTHIIDILDKVEAEDLLLLDELGAGTDPEEGAALATAILERLLEMGASTIATTHYSALKSFAYTQPGIENACVEFDIGTLRPTYRLLIGIPGASNAFAISKRLGLPDSLVLRAKQLVKADHAQFEHVINELENEKMMYEQRNADILERQQRVTAMEQKLTTMKAELSKQKGDIIRKAKEQSAAMVRRTRRESEEIIKALKEQFDDQGVKKRQQAMQEARERLNDAADRAHPGIMAQKGVGKRIDLKALEPGDIVYVTKLDQRGTVLSVRGKELEVQIGSLKTVIGASACRFVGKAPKEEKTATEKSRQAGMSLQKTATIQREIDVRGLMVNEAEMVVGKFLDDAVMAGLGQVLIIHGKGTGALRKGLQDYLKHHRNVLRYAFADITEGGTGATVVDLK